MQVQLKTNKVELSLYDIIRYQLMDYCFHNKIRISPAQLDCLGLLGLQGPINISDFCQNVVDDENIFGNTQTVRNYILKCVKENIILRSGNGNKLIQIHPDLGIIYEGNIVIEQKVYHVEK